MRGRSRRGYWMRRWAWILLEKAGESFWKFRTRLGRDLDVWGVVVISACCSASAARWAL